MGSIPATLVLFVRNIKRIKYNPRSKFHRLRRVQSLRRASGLFFAKKSYSLTSVVGSRYTNLLRHRSSFTHTPYLLKSGVCAILRILFTCSLTESTNLPFKQPSAVGLGLNTSVPVQRYLISSLVSHPTSNSVTLPESQVNYKPSSVFLENYIFYHRKFILTSVGLTS